ncbi:hypothetical protein GH714_032982 [Hevea brasiliensis]|uniref:Uncharacterized protein n=1 Tax=Hevea brasiliensis TaxID=3981 RepID=A0A6A6LL46_HEVBR|nr:hypothetical protein GH714_032982 [Hevea brasiliensis]
MHEDMKDVRDELVLLKRLVAQGVGTNPQPTLTIPTARVEITKPSAFKGARSAREIDNFLWTLDQYFRAFRVEEDARKVDHAPLFGRKCYGMVEEKNDRYGEGAKLRRLTQKGTIHLAAAIAIVESLVEFRRSEKSKPQPRDETSGGETHVGKPREKNFHSTKEDRRGKNPEEVALPKKDRPRQHHSRKSRNRRKAKRKAKGNGLQGHERSPKRRRQFRGNFDWGSFMAVDQMGMSTGQFGGKWVEVAGRAAGREASQSNGED